MADVPLLISSDNSASERRITPSWSITQLKVKLEPATGIPISSQKLVLKGLANSASVTIEAHDEDNTFLSSFALTPYQELKVIDTRPPGARPNYTDTSGVEKYIMPDAEYAKKTDSVLAWKKAQQLGRFDPSAGNQTLVRVAELEAEVARRGIAVNLRCRVGGEDSRRGVVRYVGEVPEIPSGAGPWVGVRLDEPVGKNDGSIGGTRYWEDKGDQENKQPVDSGLKFGVFVRPERVEVGDYAVLDDLEDFEEI